MVIPVRCRAYSRDLAEPFLDGCPDNLGAIVRSHVRGRATRDEQGRQGRQHIFMLELSRDDERQALPPSPCGAQKFSFACPAGPSATSCNISLFNMRSEIARHKRWFSFSRSFIRRA